MEDGPVSETGNGGSQTIINLNNNNVNGWKIAVYVIAAILLLGIGFFAGRKTIKPGETPPPIYIPGDTVEVLVPHPVPVQVIKPIDTANVIRACIANGKYYELFPERVKDSIVYVTKQDTSDVIKDWATERIYQENVFESDTVGTLTVKARTQYNRLTWLGTKFTPVTKVVTEPQKIKKFSPFLGAGISTTPSVDALGGIFFEEKYGVAAKYSYEYQLKENVYGFYFLYKF